MKTLALLALLLVLAGCSTVTMQDRETGFLLKRSSNALSKSGVGKFKITIAKDGTRTIEMTGYAQDSQDSWASLVTALTELAKTAAASSVKP